MADPEKRNGARLHKPHAAPVPQLAEIAFLIGRFEGEGWLEDPSYRYTKSACG